VYYLCDQGSIITDGSGLLEERFGGEEVIPLLKTCEPIEECCTKKGTKKGGPSQPKPTGSHTTEPSSTEGPPTDSPIPTQCGLSNKGGLGNMDIKRQRAGVTYSKFAEFPWVVLILKKIPAVAPVRGGKGIPEGIDMKASGSLIHPSVVLSSAHNIEKFVENTKGLWVRAGEWNTQTNKEMFKHVDVSVKSITIHDDYEYLINDIGLLFLKKPIPRDHHINTACLPPPNMNFDKQSCFGMGWGDSSFNLTGKKASDILQQKHEAYLKKIKLEVVPFGECEDQLRTKITTDYDLFGGFMCAGKFGL